MNAKQRQIIRNIFGNDFSPNQPKIFDSAKISKELNIPESEINAEMHLLETDSLAEIIIDQGCSEIATWISLTEKFNFLNVIEGCI